MSCCTILFSLPEADITDASKGFVTNCFSNFSSSTRQAATESLWALQGWQSLDATCNGGHALRLRVWHDETLAFKVRSRLDPVQSSDVMTEVPLCSPQSLHANARILSWNKPTPLWWANIFHERGRFQNSRKNLFGKLYGGMQHKKFHKWGQISKLFLEKQGLLGKVY